MVTQTTDHSGFDYSGTSIAHERFTGCNFKDTNFSKCHLKDIAFIACDLSGANFEGATLENVILTESDRTIMTRETNFTNAKLCKTTKSRLAYFLARKIEKFYASNVKWPLENVPTGLEDIFPLVCPETGEFIAYKKVLASTLLPPVTCSVIAKLLVPASALRSSAFGKKIRVSEAKVLSITSMNEEESFDIAYSIYDHLFTYRVGKTVKVQDFETCRWVECAAGIHCYMDRESACDYLIL